MGYIGFFEDWNLMSYHNLTRRLGTPRYVPEATLEEELTEGTWNFPLVVRVPETGEYIGLYGAVVSPPDLIDLSKWKGLKPRVQVLCFAENTDDIHWTKPDLRNEVVLDRPRFAPNQVFGTKLVIDGAPVYYDPYDPDPTQRFKYLINLSPGVHAPGYRALAVSADGKQWRIAHEFMRCRVQSLQTDLSTAIPLPMLFAMEKLSVPSPIVTMVYALTGLFYRH